MCCDVVLRFDIITTLPVVPERLLIVCEPVVPAIVGKSVKK